MRVIGNGGGIPRIASGHKAYLTYRALMDVKRLFGSLAVRERFSFFPSQSAIHSAHSQSFWQTHIFCGLLSRCLSQLMERPPLIAVGFRELGTQQEDLSRVKDPYQNDDERARGPVGGRHITTSNVKANQMLADREEQGGYRPAKPNLFPCHWVIREYFEHHGEEHGRETK
jgi:hypothetical protein